MPIQIGFDCCQLSLFIMKRIHLTLLIWLPMLVMAQNISNQNFKLNGKFVGRDTGLITLSYINLSNKEINDSVKLKKGEFVFKGLISEMAVARISLVTKSNSIWVDNGSDIFLEPVTMNITLTEHQLKKNILIGSTTQLDYERLQKQKEELNMIKEDLGAALQSIKKAKKTELGISGLSSIQDSIRSAYRKCKKREQLIDLQFIRNNPSSYLSPYLLLYYIPDLNVDSAEQVFSNLDNKVKRSKMGLNAKSVIEGKKHSSIGSVAPLFDSRDLDNKRIDLISFRKRSYVLLDFWASWCIPCRANNPHMIGQYKKYRDKGLEVIGISIDSKESNWKKAVDDNKIGIWKHIRTGSGLYDSLATKYAVDGIPTLVLIDKNGIVVGRYLGNGEEELEKLDDKLALIFAEK